MARIDIIARVFEVRYETAFREASPAQIDDFLQDLLDCRSWLLANKRASVSAPAIRNWVLGRPDQGRSLAKRPEAHAFTQQYLHWLERYRGVSHASQRENRASLLVYLSSMAGGIAASSDEDSDNRSDRDFMDDPTVKAAVWTIVNTSSHSPHSERNDLFRGSRRETEDRSYYILYRYSTTGTNIVKTFIVVNTPEPESDTFSYRHIIWCRPPEAARSNSRMRASIYRECEGVIAKFPASYYFVGYNFTVPVDRLTNPEGYIVSRQRNRSMPKGLGLLAIEYETIRRSPGLFSGLTMTLAAADQPVVARVAMLHLGTKSAARQEIKDVIVRPGELKQGDLGDDLAQVIGRLKRPGAELAEDIEAILRQPNWERTGLRRLEKEILELIDNTPAAMRAKPSKSRAGAIETAGQSPSERPRN